MDANPLRETSPGIFLEQPVLPERVRFSLSEVHSKLSEHLFSTLTNLGWQCYEFRDSDLPEINIFYALDKDTDEIALLKTAKAIPARLKRVLDFIGFPKKELRPFSVFLDPVAKEYEFGWCAFCTFETRDIWCKAQTDALALEHEAIHFMTQDIAKVKQFPVLPFEGFATWASWNVKNDVEQRQKANENYLLGPKIIEFHSGIDINHLSLDQGFSSTEQSAFGAVLFDVLNEESSGTEGKIKDGRKMGEYYRRLFTKEYDSVSTWISDLGFDSHDIENKWKQRLHMLVNTPINSF